MDSEHNAEKLQEILDRIMQGIMSILPHPYSAYPSIQDLNFSTHDIQLYIYNWRG